MGVKAVAMATEFGQKNCTLQFSARKISTKIRHNCTDFSSAQEIDYFFT